MAIHTPIPSRGRGIPPWSLAAVAFVGLVAGVYFVTNLVGENPQLGVEPEPGEHQRAIALVQEGACQACHGPDLGGQAGFPSLLQMDEGPISENLQDLWVDHPENWGELWILGTDEAVQGLDRGGMPAFGEAPYEWGEEEAAAIVAYLESQ
jgi:mono/diheme cytochrome c family protein